MYEFILVHKDMNAMASVTPDCDNPLMEWEFLNEDIKKRYRNEEIYDYIITVKVWDRTGNITEETSIGGCTFVENDDFEEQTLEFVKDHGLLDEAHGLLKKSIAAVVKEYTRTTKGA